MATLNNAQTIERIKNEYKDIVLEGAKLSDLDFYFKQGIEEYAKNYAETYIHLDEWRFYLENNNIELDYITVEDLTDWGISILQAYRETQKEYILESMENLANDGEPLFTSNDHYHNPHNFDAHVEGMQEFADVNNYNVRLCVEVYLENKEALNEIYKQ